MAVFTFEDGSTVDIVEGEDGYTIHMQKEDDGTVRMGTYTDFDKLCTDIGHTFYHIPYTNEYPKLALFLRKLYPMPKIPKKYILSTLRLAGLDISCYH